MEASSIDRLGLLRSRLRDLRVEHDQAAARFRQNQAFGDLLVGVGTRWLEETFDLPSAESRSAAARLRARWRESPEYRQLETKYFTLENEVRGTVKSVLQRPPSFRKVRDAKLVSTKLGRLEAILDQATEQLERPPSKSTAVRRRRPAPPRTREPEKPTVWEIVGAMGSGASILVLMAFLLTERLSPLVGGSLILTAIVLGVSAAIPRLWKRRSSKRPSNEYGRGPWEYMWNRHRERERKRRTVVDLEGEVNRRIVNIINAGGPAARELRDMLDVLRWWQKSDPFKRATVVSAVENAHGIPNPLDFHRFLLERLAELEREDR